MASRPIDLRTPAAPEPVRRARLRALPDVPPPAIPVADAPLPDAPEDADGTGRPVRFAPDRAERRERLATTGRGPRRLAANLLVVADAWLTPRHPAGDRSSGATRGPGPTDQPSVTLTTPGSGPDPIDLTESEPPTTEIPADPAQVDPATFPRLPERPLRARQDRPLRARQDQPRQNRPLQARPLQARPLQARRAPGRPVETQPRRPDETRRHMVEVPLRARRERPLQAPPRQAPAGAPVAPGRPTTIPATGRTRPGRVVVVPVGPSPVVAMESMRDHDTSERRPSVATPAEQPAHVRRRGTATKTMPDSRAASPEAVADEEAWQAWLSSSEPAGDRMEQLDADLAKGPRRLSRWVDAAATGRRTRTD
jgi:hypothetical protein